MRYFSGQYITSNIHFRRDNMSYHRLEIDHEHYIIVIPKMSILMFFLYYFIFVAVLIIVIF